MEYLHPSNLYFPTYFISYEEAHFKSHLKIGNLIFNVFFSLNNLIKILYLFYALNEKYESAIYL